MKKGRLKELLRSKTSTDHRESDGHKWRCQIESLLERVHELVAYLHSDVLPVLEL